ncbi:hypothetical protein ACODM8_20275 [Vibrio ostreicida]|uniref:hypothetical protein n=1 Tax=Vibrio ostreicida TaxID=526588 RepID=UPI003B5BFE2E
MRNIMLSVTVSLMASMGLFSPASALSLLQGDPILWVSGNIANTNADDQLVFDLAMIEGLNQGKITTNNHVVEEMAEYTGPLLMGILDHVGAKGASVKVIAWDDYVVRISIADIKKYGVLLATHENGERMTIDGKGPFFIVFPFSQYPELRSNFYYSLSAWQVKELVVE